MRTRTLGLISAGVTLAGSAVGLAHAPAHADATAIVAVNGTTLVVSAPGTGANNVQLYLDGAYIWVRDNEADPFVGAGCEPTGDPEVVKCLRASLTAFSITVGDGDDQVLLNDLQVPGTVDGGVGNDYIGASSQAEVFIGGEGRDTVSYLGSTEGVRVTFDGLANDGTPGEGDRVGNDVERVFGSDFDDVLIGSAREETLLGADGDDLIDGGLGKDQIAGNDGFDTVTYQNRTNPVNVQPGVSFDDGEAGEQDLVNTEVERVIGGSGGDVLVGTDADNVLVGGPGADVLQGNVGNDLLQGGAGPDVHQGGAGADCASYVERTAAVVVTVGTVGVNGEQGEGDSVDGEVECVLGGKAGDTLTGDGGTDDLQGRGGNDVLDGGTGADVLNGGTGRDKVTYAGRTAAVTADLDNLADDGEAGEGDRITASVEQLVGGSGDDTLTGSATKNLLSGGGGADLLNGLGAADNLVGGAGVDTVTYAGRSKAVTVTINAIANDGAAGEGDRVATDVERVIGGNGGDTLTGSSQANGLTGGGGADTLNGGGGNDFLGGGNGADTLVGGNGTDSANGGAGTDTCSAETRTDCER